MFLINLDTDNLFLKKLNPMHTMSKKTFHETRFPR